MQPTLDERHRQMPLSVSEVLHVGVSRHMWQDAMAWSLLHKICQKKCSVAQMHTSAVLLLALQNMTWRNTSRVDSII